MTIQYRRFEEDADLASQRELFQLSFPESIGTSAASIEHYRWKFRGTPSEPQSFEYVAEDAQGLVGYYAALPFPYKIGNALQKIGMVCDVMTHPRARGKGVFTALGHYATGDLASRGITLVTGYPVRPEVIPGHLKVGWSIAFSLPVYFYPLRADAVLRRAHLPFLAPFLNALLALFRLRLPRRHHRLHVTLESAEIFETSAYETFLSKWLDSKAHALVKTTAFLKWRLGAPGVKYSVAVARANQEIQALAIIREAHLHGVPMVAILDIMALPGHEHIVPHLHQAILRFALTARCEAIALAISPSWAKSYKLAKAPYFRTPVAFKVIMKALEATSVSDHALDPEKAWHLMWIDSDDL